MWTRYHHCHPPSPGSQSQHVKMGSAVRRGLGSPFLCVLTCGGDGPRCLAMMPSLLRTRGAPRSSGNPQKLSSRPAPFTACPIRVHGLPHPRHGHTPRPDGLPFRPRRASVACRPGAAFGGRPPTMVAVLACPVHRTRIPAPPYVARQDCSPLSIWARTLLPDAAAPAKPPAVCFHVNHLDNRVSELLSPAFKSSACSSLTVANIPTCPLWSSLFPSP